MSYHGSTTSQSTTNTQGQQAPPGFHYMPDGTLMADSEMRQQAPSQQVAPGELVITSFEMDFSSITAAGETRSFVVSGSRGSTFEVEVKNEDNYYYNFHTKAFQSAKSVLSRLLRNSEFYGHVTFPAVTDNDQYDISITATKDTKHSDYYEARFGDGSMDINSTTGSNSRLMTKVIYQYVDLVLTINPYSSGGTITGTAGNATVAISAGAGLTEAVAFSTTFTVANDKALQIIKQPTHLDILSFVLPVVGAAPVDIPGENIYPTATAAFTGDDINGAITSGAIVEIDADVAGNVVIGDKITTPVTTDTVNGAVGGGGVVVTMDSVAATKMAVGDQVTGNSTLDRSIITVVETGGSTFKLSEAVVIADGITLTFSSKINRSLTTVLNLDPSGEAKQFTMSQDIQFRDNAPLTFFNQMNYRWPVDNFAHVMKPGFIFVTGTGNLVASSVLAKYSDTTAVFAGTAQEKVYTNYEVEAVDTLSLKPSITRGEITEQAGAITFDKQQPLVLAGDTLKAGGYGQNEILSVFGYDVRFTDLAIALTPVITTTTAASAGGSSTSVVVASRNGILDAVSTVSGIGIDPAAVDPTVASGAGAVTGAGTIVLSAAQSLEDGATLTFANAGLVATITGNIHVLKAGTASQTLRFDIDNLLSIT